MIIRSLTESGKAVWLDTTKQTMTVIPVGSGYLGKNGVMYPVFESLAAFIESGEKQSIVHAYCSSKEKVKKRFKYGLEFQFGKVEFFNCEYSPIGWIKHAFDDVYPDKAYRILIERHNYCLNEVLIKYCKEIKKPI